MISLIIPPKDQIARVNKMLADEFGTASNIKSRVNRLSVLGAITSVQQRLKLYNKGANSFTREGKKEKWGYFGLLVEKTAMVYLFFVNGEYTVSVHRLAIKHFACIRWLTDWSEWLYYVHSPFQCLSLLCSGFSCSCSSFVSSKTLKPRRHTLTYSSHTVFCCYLISPWWCEQTKNNTLIDSHTVCECD